MPGDVRSPAAPVRALVYEPVESILVTSVLREQFLLKCDNFVHSENTISEHMAIFKKNICKLFQYLENFFRYDIAYITVYYY